MDGETFIDRQIALLQGGFAEFKFSNYLESNLGLSVQELVNVFRQVYPNVEQGEGAQVGEVRTTESENVENVVPSEVGEVETSEQVTLKVRAEVNVEEEEVGKEVQEEVGPADENLGNVREI